jgi:signal transduction histidine kinase
MKPLLSESEDQDALRMLGRASVQIVHDLKNQLNGLKLYATFLKKRLEKSERPAEELDTINKLIAGLDRSARDASMIAEYGRPVQLKKQAGLDLETIVRQIAAGLKAENSDGSSLTQDTARSVVLNVGAAQLLGEFDPVLIADALKSISLSAAKLSNAPEDSLEINLRDETNESNRSAVIFWRVSDSSDHDPFHSFAGSNELRLSLAARVIEAHGGSARREQGGLCVRLPLGPNSNKS